MSSVCVILDKVRNKKQKIHLNRFDDHCLNYFVKSYKTSFQILLKLKLTNYRKPKVIIQGLCNLILMGNLPWGTMALEPSLGYRFKHLKDLRSTFDITECNW